MQGAGCRVQGGTEEASEGASDNEQDADERPERPERPRPRPRQRHVELHRDEQRGQQLHLCGKRGAGWTALTPPDRRVLVLITGLPRS